MSVVLLFNNNLRGVSNFVGWHIRTGASAHEGVSFNSGSTVPGGYTNLGTKPWCSVEMKGNLIDFTPYACTHMQTGHHAYMCGPITVTGSVREFVLMFNGSPSQITTGGTQGAPKLGDTLWVGYNGTDVVGGLNYREEWSFTTALLSGGEAGAATLAFTPNGGQVRTGNMVQNKVQRKVSMEQYAITVGADEHEQTRQALEAYYR